jgi:hypothetical protein
LKTTNERIKAAPEKGKNKELYDGGVGGDETIADGSAFIQMKG